MSRKISLVPRLGIGNSQIVLVHSLCMHDLCSVPVCTCDCVFACIV